MIGCKLECILYANLLKNKTIVKYQQYEKEQIDSKNHQYDKSVMPCNSNFNTSQIVTVNFHEFN